MVNGYITKEIFIGDHSWVCPLKWWISMAQTLIGLERNVPTVDKQWVGHELSP